MRISMTAIANVVGHRAWFEKNLVRSPLTGEVIAKCVESHEHYLIRKVRWAENYYREQGITPSRHKLEGLAGTRARAGRTEKVEAAINAALKHLNGMRS